MSVAETIRAACVGRVIRRGPWSDTDGSMDALHAVLVAHGAWKPGQSRIRQLCKLLDVDAFWIHCFLMGFDRNYQIMYRHESDSGKVWWSQDPVSKLGITIAREVVQQP